MVPDATYGQGERRGSGLAERIKIKAASHLNKLIDELDADRGIAKSYAESDKHCIIDAGAS